MNNFARLEPVNLREGWPHEALDFTKWLSKEENIELLSKETGLNIKVLQTEAGTGRYSLDILAMDENTEQTIIIENQLEMTNHDHLGKLIVYGAGHDATYQIWIVRDYRDEHKQAIDWLNEHTDKNINIFLVKLELWKIGDSALAPKFQIISQPNDFVKSLHDQKTKSEGLNGTNITRLHFWENFINYCKENNTTMELTKPTTRHYLIINMRDSRCHIAVLYFVSDGSISCELYIPDNKELFEFLLKNQGDIEEKIGEKLEWQYLDGKKASRISLSNNANISLEGSNWNEAFEWMKSRAEKFIKVFSDYVQKF